MDAQIIADERQLFPMNSIRWCSYRNSEATEQRKQACSDAILDTATRLFGKYDYHNHGTDGRG